MRTPDRIYTRDSSTSSSSISSDAAVYLSSYAGVIHFIFCFPVFLLSFFLPLIFYSFSLFSQFVTCLNCLTLDCKTVKTDVHKRLSTFCIQINAMEFPFEIQTRNFCSFSNLTKLQFQSKRRIKNRN